jgi:predicted glycoside hydrolase/deacetylase ChbG (UPF0249 family)
MKFRINADDFGISPGVNSAIEKMFRLGRLNSASLICGCGYFDEAIAIAKRNPDLEIGLHFNITNGSSRIANGFLSLLLMAIFQRKSLIQKVEKELRAQISLIEQNGIKLSHIDSHRHVHMIFGIFGIVKKVAAEKKISRVRIINESLTSTCLIAHPKKFLWNGNLIKWFVLTALRIINCAQSNRYFFSILYTCEISEELIKKINIPKKFSDSEIEIMIHPGDPEIDQKIEFLEEKNHLISPARKQEFRF